VVKAIEVINLYKISVKIHLADICSALSERLLVTVCCCCW